MICNFFYKLLVQRGDLEELRTGSRRIVLRICFNHEAYTRGWFGIIGSHPLLQNIDFKTDLGFGGVWVGYEREH